MRFLALILLGATTSLSIAAVRAADTSVAMPTAIRHQPVRPKPVVRVLITAQLAKGTSKPTLKLQAVAPGKYIRKSDPDYEKQWIDLPMHDDGRDGDEKAGDGIYSIDLIDVISGNH